jgi:hypothetical protein
MLSEENPCLQIDECTLRRRVRRINVLKERRGGESRLRDERIFREGDIDQQIQQRALQRRVPGITHRRAPVERDNESVSHRVNNNNRRPRQVGAP